MEKDKQESCNIKNAIIMVCGMIISAVIGLLAKRSCQIEPNNHQSEIASTAIFNERRDQSQPSSIDVANNGIHLTAIPLALHGRK